ncbi:MAG: alfa-L-rhamnosidase, partial [Clostridia bacterium]|nr:alfa-L-rhamnosidase [Clostridia bacterium]
FRYIRVDKFPVDIEITEETFTAIAVYSKMKQTGNIRFSHEKLNQFFSNVLWGQRSNFLDVPTDCPQRDERFGWTGDAQVFCKAAGYNFDVEQFFRKWLRDMDALRKTYGAVGFTVPRSWDSPIAAGWSDAAVIVPWQMYRTYGDKEFLAEMIDMMQAHVDMIGRESEEEDTWRGGYRLNQFGDWLATDLEDAVSDESFTPNEYSGATRPNFIQAAFYAYDTKIVADALKVLGKDDAPYRALFERIKKRFQADFPVYRTQTECVLALKFGLTPNVEETVSLLEQKIIKNGNRLSTGFLGTSHLLHVLSENGKTELAYTLLLQEEYPSWLYSVNLGATTVWEHWDSINPEGEMWSTDMNSFNHYAYGAVVDWVYEVAGGIRQEKNGAGFTEIVINPHPDKRLQCLETSYDSKNGKISSKWSYTLDGNIRYEITVPATAKIILNGKEKTVEKGTYIFVEKAV